MMTIKIDKTGQAEYDRLLDLMAKMYLKYGYKYRLVTTEDVLKQFQTANAKIVTVRRKGLSPLLPYIGVFI